MYFFKNFFPLIAMGGGAAVGLESPKPGSFFNSKIWRENKTLPQPIDLNKWGGYSPAFPTEAGCDTMLFLTWVARIY